jgi:D-sedoheptulose 7-phosphate isomerase
MNWHDWYEQFDYAAWVHPDYGAVGTPVTFDGVVALLKKTRQRGQLYFIGNGGSAAIASHMAIDFFNKGKFAARCFNDAAALTCIANDYGYKSVFDMQVARVIKKGDVLVAVSSSGESDNILRAAKTAKMVTDVVTLTGFKYGNRLQQMGTYNFHVPSTNYGIVETAHLGLLHALLEAVSE